MPIQAYLKSSQFAVGLVRTLRGLKADVRVFLWLAKRHGQIADYLRSPGTKKLQLGTSNNLLDGWLNTDVFLNRAGVVYLNATKRFPFDNKTFEYVTAEHMIEHLDYPAGQVMLRETFRVLKPGGCVRIATPDLGVLLALHSRGKTDLQKDYIEWCAARFVPEVRQCKDVFVINNAFRAWGHCFLYDRETLHYALSMAGFREIMFYKPGDSEDPMLRNIETHGREIGSEEINQFETIVVEGRKVE